ncbi:adenylate kinase [Clostridiaceae bacterium HSG29]|nr:adenylate kinase [Clostridiaceae bacterium HSG29]
MRLILLGPPGAGKGTQAGKIAKKYNIPHISTGDIFRANIVNKTDLGILAKKYIDNGELVPDSVVMDIVRDRLIQDDTKNGFLLDGFPRTLEQAIALDEMLNNNNMELSGVIKIKVNFDLLIARITGRRICKECGATYHVDFNKPKKSDVCDLCNGELYQRSDDNEDVVRNRINVYIEQTTPLIKYYTNHDILKIIDGEQSIDDVFSQIVKEVE